MRDGTKEFGVIPGALLAAIASWRTATGSRIGARRSRATGRWLRLGLAVGAAGLAAATASVAQGERSRRDRARRSAQIDEALSQTFPASDPPAVATFG